MNKKIAFILIILIWSVALGFAITRGNRFRRGGSNFTVNRSVCIGCGLCVGVCPVKNAITFKQGVYKPIIDPELCNRCGACLSVCPVQAVEIR